MQALQLKVRRATAVSSTSPSAGDTRNWTGAARHSARWERPRAARSARRYTGAGAPSGSAYTGTLVFGQTLEALREPHGGDAAMSTQSAAHDAVAPTDVTQPRSEVVGSLLRLQELVDARSRV